MASLNAQPKSGVKMIANKWLIAALGFSVGVFFNNWGALIVAVVCVGAHFMQEYVEFKHAQMRELASLLDATRERLSDVEAKHAHTELRLKKVLNRLNLERD